MQHSTVASTASCIWYVLALNVIPQMSHRDDVPYSVQVNAGTVPQNRPQVVSMCPLYFKVLTAHDLMLYNVWS